MSLCDANPTHPALAPQSQADAAPIHPAKRNEASQPRLPYKRSSSYAYVAKYGEVWRFEVADGAFRNTESDDPVPVFRIQPSKVIAFAKDPHAQTTYRFAATGRR